jgi:hypothetical protein
METLFMGYGEGLIRASLRGGVTAEWVLQGAPVAQVAVDPLERDRVYAATLGKGLWRSDDGGETFERLPSLENELVWSVAVSPSDRSGGLGRVYAGTQMSALYTSADGSDSFRELESVQDIPSRPEWSFPPAPDTHHVHQITLDIDEPGNVLFGVELGGVYRSTDAGETWTRTTADPDPHTLRTHPTEPGRMYQGGGASYNESRDGGATWQRGLEGIPDEVRYFYSLAVDAGDPENVILSGARDPFSGHGVIPGVPVWSSLYRLEDGVWRELSDGLPPRDGTAMGALAAGDPGVFFYVTEEGDIFRSEDGGRGFEQLGYEPSADARGTKARSLTVVTD